ncbi:unnamed protein product, partial [Symbiodinium microadriaticum]
PRTTRRQALHPRRYRSARAGSKDACHGAADLGGLGHPREDLGAAFLGGGLGAALRFAGTKAGARLGWSVWTTFLINIVGCCLLGVLTALLPSQSRLRVLLGTGLCGGLTTFSTFAVEAVQLTKQGLYAKAVRYVALSNIGGIVAGAAALSAFGG